MFEFTKAIIAFSLQSTAATTNIIVIHNNNIDFCCKHPWYNKTATKKRIDPKISALPTIAATDSV